MAKTLRKMLRLVLVCLLYGLILHCSPLQSHSTEDESMISSAESDYFMEAKVSSNPLVVGGTEAVEGLFPWMVALYLKGEFVCSATLVSDRLVLTAAHCVIVNGVLQSYGDYVGHAGSTNRSSPKLRIEFEDIKFHPDYNFQDNDVAILVMTERVVFGDTLNRLCLSSVPKKKEKYRDVLAMGWGRASRKAALYKNVLQFAWLKVVKNSLCSIVQKTLKPSTICAAGINRGICDGDSGGPLIAFSRRGPPFRQVGIASYVNSKMGCGRLSIYSRVSYYHKFISQIAESYNSTACFVSG